MKVGLIICIQALVACIRADAGCSEEIYPAIFGDDAYDTKITAAHVSDDGSLTTLYVGGNTMNPELVGTSNSLQNPRAFMAIAQYYLKTYSGARTVTNGLQEFRYFGNPDISTITSIRFFNQADTGLSSSTSVVALAESADSS